MSDAIAVLSGRAETLGVMEDAIAARGIDPESWLPRFHEQRRAV